MPGWRIPTLTVILGLLFWDAARIWMPSILFVVGDAGSTPATTLGAIALGTVAVPAVAIALLGDMTPRVAWIAGVAGLVVGRLVLVIADGGQAQFFGSTTSVIAAGLVLAAITWSRPDDPTIRIAWMGGIVTSTVVHVILGGIDAIWRDGALAALWTLIIVVIAVSIARNIGWSVGTPSDPPDDQVADEHDDSATVDDRANSAWPWIAIGLAIALFGILIAPSGRIAIATGWTDRLVAAATIGIASTVILAAITARWFTPRASGAIAAATIALGTIAALRPLSFAAVAGQWALAAGIGLIAGMTVPRTPRLRRRSVAARSLLAVRALQRRRHARASAVSIFVFALVGFAYYAPYDLLLPYPSRAVLLFTAAILAVMALAATRVSAPAQVRRIGTGPLSIAVGLTVFAMLIGVGLAPGEPDDPSSDDSQHIRVVVYNLHMGFDTAGQLSIGRLADTLAEIDPDIIVLNEVDRGWMTTGSRDDLRIIERAVHQPSQFAPAADDVWGNALLSRWPIIDFRFDRLARGRDAMARSMFTGTLQLADERQLAVIGTHLSHVDQQGDTRLPQARALAAEVARVRDRGLPVIVAADFNAQPGSPELLTFGAFVRSAVPPDNPTWPSWEPEVQIDHVLISPEFEVISWHYLDTQDSDHFGIVVDLWWPRS